MFDPFSCAQSIRDDLLSYTSSALPVGNNPSQLRLGERFYDRWSSELFQGPFVEALPKYQSCESLSETFADASQSVFASLMSRASSIRWRDVDEKFVRFMSARDRLWSGYPQEAEAEEAETSVSRLWHQRRYRHQLESFRLIAKERKSAIVATGTGSGKTECYLIPLLHMLITEAAERRELRGVRAIMLFPLNALVEDQMRRLRKILFWTNLAIATAPPGSAFSLKRQITFGRYTGDTPVSDLDHDRSKPADHIQELGEMVTRVRMRREPPDILVTNFSMLEYALLRSDDRDLLSVPHVFTTLILDEVHTYSGTVGAEVAMLLRRLRAQMAERAASALDVPIFVGTSATIGTEKRASGEMAAFAQNLFGCAFRSDQIVMGSTEGVLTRGTVLGTDALRQLASDAMRFVARSPLLLKLISGRLIVDEEPDWESRISDDLEELALLFGATWKDMEVEIRDVEPLAGDPEARSRDLLGHIVEHSDAIHQLITTIQGSAGACLALEDLTARFFASATPAEGALIPGSRAAVCLMLTLVANAKVRGRTVLPVRFHHFVTEKREGFLCLNPNCEEGLRSQTDGWWSQLFLRHFRACPTCGCFAYPIVLCRKCGFVYLEGWRQRDDTCVPEKDESTESFRFLFRPAAGMQYTRSDLCEDAADPNSQPKSRGLCVTCGCWFVSLDTTNGEDARRGHSSRCANPRIIEVFEWSDRSGDYRMPECAVCQQRWYEDHEVVTPPTISPYAAASLLIEDLVGAGSAPRRATKLISFSDTRQQAAKLARNLQRTNRDYVFRQLVFQLLATGSKPLTTLELFHELSREIRNDDGKRQLLIDFPGSVNDDLLLEQNIADLLYRELTSAYHTLEALGLVRIDYSDDILSCGNTIQPPAAWRSVLSTVSGKDLIRLVLDWGFRYRHAVASAAQKVPIRANILQLWKIFIKRVPGPEFGKKGQFEAALFLDRVDPRNRLFNFMYRVRELERGARKYLPELDGRDFNTLLQSVWTALVSRQTNVTFGRTGAEANRALLAPGLGDAQATALQLNLNSITWTSVSESAGVFQCSVCGRLSNYSIANVCPVRKCQGSLKPASLSDVEQRFAPTRHYRRLIREREVRPLRVEEHTAEIANARRLEIERAFRADDAGSVDVISGSTTFELGIDLGSVSSVFLANLPPRVSNYRQRAGRAGRREGLVPFVLSYVRERPHDQYFWGDLNSFISGPISTPKFKLASEEVLRRHGYSVLLSFALADYKKAGRPPGKLWGPEWKNLLSFLLDPGERSSLTSRALDPKCDVALTISNIYSDIGNALRTRLTPAKICEGFLKRVECLRLLRSEEGCIKVLGDYAVLPTYAFPIYVDELRLNEVPPNQPPRCDLQLTRDRRISLTEYFPGRIVVAGKSLIQSRGLWAGYVERDFRRCAACGEMLSSLPATTRCRCGGSLAALNAVTPAGGYFGTVLGEGSPPEVEYDETSSSEVLFDPANDSFEECFKPAGRFLRIAAVDANLMKNARMRQFSPKPGSKLQLQLEKRNLLDVAAPHTPAACLVKVTAPGSPSYHLLHEFSTDIVRMRISNAPEGRTLQCAFASAAASRDVPQRQKLRNSFWLTFAETLLIASARFLDIDEVGNAELGVAFRTEVSEPCLDNREVILFDTAPGGAGYATEIAANIETVFRLAATVLGRCSCGDSCYHCLRSYRNQWIHSRLDRHLVFKGLAEFNSLNWS